MTKLFRSKSCGGAVQPHVHASAAFFQSSSFSGQQDGDNDDDDDEDVDCCHLSSHPINKPFISPDRRQHPPQSNNFSLLALLLAALRKSLVTCAVDDSEYVSNATSSLDIGCPTDVRHVSHVTFDPFDGFLGLPLDLQPDVPRKPPSASITVFGVSAESMQCSYDERGNSVPTILLMMQKRLYSGGGLQSEGIFRINAENGQEEDVRRQLNRGFVPHGIDVHCLAGLIKAWFRELPTGVLDSLTPEQVMRCNTETECGDLVKTLPPTKAALLDWAVNLMADVVEHEKRNKMNARNIAMVFAPNMTQMADPLTALIHAVQVMNLLKTLVVKTLREREPPPAATFSCRKLEDPPAAAATLNRLGSEHEEQFWSFPRRSESVAADYEYVSGKSSPASECDHRSKQEVEGILERLSLRKGVRRLCRHPVFQLSRLTKKNRGVTGEAWA